MQSPAHDRREQAFDFNNSGDGTSMPASQSEASVGSTSSFPSVTEAPGNTTLRAPNPESSSEGLLSPSGTLRGGNSRTRPRLQTKASTALSLTDIYTRPEHERLPTSRPSRSRAPSAVRTVSLAGGPAVQRNNDVAEDNASIRSFRSTRSVAFGQEHGDTVESLLGDTAARLGGAQELQSDAADDVGDILTDLANEDTDFCELFGHEFDELEPLAGDGHNEESLTVRWQCKLKHFLILSSAGKPIYSRHGDDQLISGSIGVIQTIISFFLDSGDTLKEMVAGGARFAIVSKGHLHLVAISRIGEDDAQLRGQLEALYMQILSTLTLPNMQRIFINRPSTDLRRPLEGTASLISALADDFTRGSPSTLLSALECLKLRKTQREVINQSMLRCKSQNLLYGLLVAGGRLVSVIRPKKHSLHPGDLHLIFNMLFKAGGIRAAGGENWIPLCLPGFNNTGYLYMFVSFLENGYRFDDRSSSSSQKDNETAIILISAVKESFYELRQMRDELVEQLEHNGSMAIIRSAVSGGRPTCSQMMPGTAIRHFLYKSRANVQFVMPNTEKALQSPLAWRKLISVYASLHATMHGKMSHLKIHHARTTSCVSLAWVTPTFELYCVAPPATSRDVLAFQASRLEQWARREQERLFIIGGAVF